MCFNAALFLPQKTTKNLIEKYECEMQSYLNDSKTKERKKA